MRTRLKVVALLALAVVPLGLAVPSASAGGGPEPAWEPRPTGTTGQFRGLAAVDHRTAWLAGSGGTVLRTSDSGRTWRNVSPPDASALEFRDVEAFDSRHAVVLAIGTGEDSRVLLTSDGGATWRATFVNDEPAAFYDCVTFLDRKHGLALSDPVEGKFRILATHDGGASWRVQPGDGMPAALEGEFAFAASGTCLVSGPGHTAWFATGGGASARVFRTSDGGRHWQATATPVASGPSAGIYSLAFRDSRHGLAVGGDYTTPTEAVDAAATTSDGGRTWQLVPAGKAPGGYRSGSTWLAHSPVGLAVGPSGSDVTYDGGRSWKPFDTGAYDSVDCAGAACWASGPQGRAAVLTWR
ncbi:WD40/YVTN/BNR-like repeat-containing protein [Flindersiella endophytica]